MIMSGMTGKLDADLMHEKLAYEFHHPLARVGFEKNSIRIPKPSLIRPSAIRKIAVGTDDTAYPLTATAMQHAPSTTIERPCTK
jgi:hypothetical protein